MAEHVAFPNKPSVTHEAAERGHVATDEYALSRTTIYRSFYAHTE